MMWFWIVVAVVLVVGLGLAWRHDRLMKHKGRALNNSGDIGYETTRNSAIMHGGGETRSGNYTG